MIARLGVGKRAKHIDTQFMFAQHLIRDGLVQVVAVPGAENVADIGTKYVTAAVLAKLLSQLNVRIITMIVVTSTAAGARRAEYAEEQDDTSETSFLKLVGLISIMGLVFGMAMQAGKAMLAGMRAKTVIQGYPVITQTRVTTTSHVGTQTDPTTEPKSTKSPQVYTMVHRSSVVHTQVCQAVRSTTGRQETRTLCMYCARMERKV